MKSEIVRAKFTEYFAKLAHQVVPSSSLIPTNDATLLFTNAGMVQFKDVFLGVHRVPYQKAVSVQRCVRAGGKHNDLENVGYTARHLTFFEMLGNFSFGDYFKREAIQFAWKFLTEELKLAPEKLWVTVYEEDIEAEKIWLQELKVDPTRFSRCGKQSNFWSMGDVGPCGPCSEIFYDYGPSVAGGPPGTPEEDGDRYTEIWNLVFMQYDRREDGTLTPLPKPSVDTGMGLERLCAVMQGVQSSYDTDLLVPLIQYAATLTKTSDLKHFSLRVLADHIRSSAFLIVDGIVPSNEGRGYVLRRIIRRACRHGHKLGVSEPFFFRLVEALHQIMGPAYPELSRQREIIERVLKQEEEQFAYTLTQGMHILDTAIAQLGKQNVLPGSVAFKLYDTYGFPLDLTADVLREKSISVDIAEFDKHMEQQRKQSRQAKQFRADYHAMPPMDYHSEFVGYEQTDGSSVVESIISDGQEVKSAGVGYPVLIILKNTPFYAESGGQVGDAGTLHHDLVHIEIEDCQKRGNAILHVGTIQKGTLEVGMTLQATVDKDRRSATMANHSATHLLHAALRKNLGEHVMQKGSWVGPTRLRFDFAHHQAVTAEQIIQLEWMVNQHIRANVAVTTELMNAKDAQACGAMALFGEKYGETVRVLSMSEFSKELCGGTHVARTGDIGLFKIITEEGIAAGIRRIEAVTGVGAIEWLNAREQILKQSAELLKCDVTQLVPRIDQVITKSRDLERQFNQLQQQLAKQGSDAWSNEAREVSGVKVFVKQITQANAKVLRQTLDELKQQLTDAVIVLGGTEQDKIQIVVGVTGTAAARFSAVDIVNFVANQVGGQGGGRRDMAQAGGNDVAKLPDALASVFDWVTANVK